MVMGRQKRCVGSGNLAVIEWQDMEGVGLFSVRLQDMRSLWGLSRAVMRQKI